MVVATVDTIQSGADCLRAGKPAGAAASMAGQFCGAHRRAHAGGKHPVGAARRPSLTCLRPRQQPGAASSHAAPATGLEGVTARAHVCFV